MSRYLVTGCAGFIGSHLSDSLLAAGHEVVGVDCFTDYYARERKELNLDSAREHESFTLFELDLAEAPLTSLVAEVDGIFHLAAQAGVRGSWGETFDVYLRNNILATQRLFEAAAAAGVRVAFASSSSVYGNAEAYPTREDAHPRPVSPYGVTKLSCEHLADAYASNFGLDVVALRYFTVFGPRQRPDMAFARICEALLRGTPFAVYGTGEQSRDFTFVGDAVAATVGAFERGRSGEVYNVGGGTEAKLAHVIQTLERLASRKLQAQIQERAPGDANRTSADTAKLRSDVGWAPRIGLEVGLARELEFVASQVTEPSTA